MSVYLFVSRLCSVYFYRTATFGRFHSTLMGNLARDVLFRMPARDVIHYSRSPALTNLMHCLRRERIK